MHRRRRNGDGVPGSGRTGRSRPTHNARYALRRELLIARIDPFRAERHSDIASGHQATSTQRLDKKVRRAAHIGRRRENQELAGMYGLNSTRLMQSRDDLSSGPALQAYYRDAMLVASGLRRLLYPLATCVVVPATKSAKNTPD